MSTTTDGHSAKCEAPPGLDEVIKEKSLAKRSYEIRTTQGEKGEKGNNINQVWADLGIGEITVDSVADEPRWPKDLGGAFETRPSKKNIVLKTANGGEMGHYGDKEATFKD